MSNEELLEIEVKSMTPIQASSIMRASKNPAYRKVGQWLDDLVALRDELLATKEEIHALHVELHGVRAQSDSYKASRDEFMKRLQHSEKRRPSTSSDINLFISAHQSTLDRETIAMLARAAGALEMVERLKLDDGLKGQ